MDNAGIERVRDNGKDTDQIVKHLLNAVADIVESTTALNTNIQFFIENYKAKIGTNNFKDGLEPECCNTAPLPSINFLKDCRDLSDVSVNIIFNELKSLYLTAISNGEQKQAVGYLMQIREIVSLRNSCVRPEVQE